MYYWGLNLSCCHCFLPHSPISLLCQPWAEPFGWSRSNSCLSPSTEGSNTVPRPSVPASGPDGAPREATGTQQRSEPGKETGPLSRSPGRRRGRSPAFASAAGQRSGAGRPLLTAPFAQAHPASFPPGRSPGTAQPRRPHQTAQKSRPHRRRCDCGERRAETGNRGARGADPGPANRGRAKAGPDILPATLRAPASPALRWLRRLGALRAKLFGTCSSAAAG